MSAKIQYFGRMQHQLKKLNCPDHGYQYTYFCNYNHCDSPYICHLPECIDNHFHQHEQVVLTKVDREKIIAKIERANSLIGSTYQIHNEVHKIKLEVDQIQKLAIDAFEESRTYEEVCQGLRKNFDQALNSAYLNTIDEILNLEGKIQHKLETLRVKIPPFEDTIYSHSARIDLLKYLEVQIQNFSWADCSEIYSTRQSYLGVEKFHERLCGKTKLLFLFYGEGGEIAGSYYSEPYPNLNEHTRKDLRSFIFLSLHSSDFATYVANPTVEAHIMVSQRIAICHGNTPSYADGIRTFHKSLDSLEYYLPSKSFIGDIAASGKIKIKLMSVMQISSSPTKKTFD